MKFQRIRPAYVIGPGGKHLSLKDLPAPSTNWIPRRKAEVVAAVEGGLLSLEEACERYSLSLQELAGWQTAIERFGLAGLRTTKNQYYRSKWKCEDATLPGADRRDRATAERHLNPSEQE